MTVAVTKECDLSIRDIIYNSPVRDAPNAEEILRRCILRSEEVRYGYHDGSLACVWGLIPPTIMSDTAYLWLLTTNIATEHKFLFVRHSQRYIEEALKVYPRIVGDANASDESAKKWLRWLGAEFEPPFGGRMNFVIRRK